MTTQPDFETLAKEYLKLGKYAEEEAVLKRSVEVLGWCIPNLSPVHKNEEEKPTTEQLVEHLRNRDSSFLPVRKSIPRFEDANIPHSPVYIRSRVALDPREGHTEVCVWLFFLEPQTKYWAEFATCLPVSKPYLCPEFTVENLSKNGAWEAIRSDNLNRLLLYFEKDVFEWAKGIVSGEPAAESRARFLIQPPDEVLKRTISDSYHERKQDEE